VKAAVERTIALGYIEEVILVVSRASHVTLEAGYPLESAYYMNMVWSLENLRPNWNSFRCLGES
jgi:hypothetical protein